MENVSRNVSAIHKHTSTSVHTSFFLFFKKVSNSSLWTNLIMYQVKDRIKHANFKN